MQVTLLASATSPAQRGRQFLTSYLLNDSVAIDAGCLGFCLSSRAQGRIKHLFVTHSHLDHVASLPMFLDQAYTGQADCVTVYGTIEVLDCLRSDLFNDRLWPNLIRISGAKRPYVKLREIKPRRPLTVDGLILTPISMNHVIPTVGFLVSDEGATIAIASDTGPTEELWKRAGAADNLRAVFLEATFPNGMAWLADLAKHLTPQMFADEVKKLPPGVPVHAVHIHPRYRDEVVRELRRLKLKNLSLARFGVPYRF